MIPFLDLKQVTAMHAEEIQKAVNRVVEGGWYLLGKELETFERHYAEYIGTRHCVGCANGLDALILMMRAYMENGVLKAGDEVIVPANTYIATILAITECGLRPVLVEPDIETLQIDGRLIEGRLTERTRAVMLVHLYGRCAYTPQIAELCCKHGLLLFEDNAQAHGCLSGSRRTGSLGNAAAHSFYPGKNLGALGDGGAVTTDDDEVAETLRALRNYGSQKKYVFKYQGRNSRLDEVQAAVLDIKLRYLDKENAHRREIARYYAENIHNPAVRVPAGIAASCRNALKKAGSNSAVNEANGAGNVYHIFPVLSNRRDELQRHLTECGVQTLIHYPIPPHKQECYREWNALSYPITERIANEELSLPISQYMASEDAAKVVEAVNAFAP